MPKRSSKFCSIKCRNLDSYYKTQPLQKIESKKDLRKKLKEKIKIMKEVNGNLNV